MNNDLPGLSDLDADERELNYLLSAVPPQAPPVGFRDAVMRRVAERRVGWELLVAALLALPSLAYLARHFDRKPVDAQLLLRRLRPFVTKQRPGRALRREAGMASVFTALTTNSRAPVRLRFREVKPRVTRRSIGPVIVIRRGSNRLYLYDGMRLWRVFGVATGQSIYPTPLGRWSIVVKWRNPWWYPPSSSWAQGQKPIPPGPGNPLGTRWMGLSASGVGIHGTPDDSSIGYSASHGCIRMHIPDAEWLFNHLNIGTTVFIVSA